MKQTIFVMGRSPQLGLLELQSKYSDIEPVISGVARTSSEVSPQDILALGGTVKLVEEVWHGSEITPEQLVTILVSGKHDPSKLSFGLSAYGVHIDTNTYLREMKEILTSQGVASRYVETKEEQALSSVQIATGHIEDVVVIAKSDHEFIVGKTFAVQDFAAWGMRDREKPVSDPRGGMLPPKVARMIVNIAAKGLEKREQKLLYDPFCGTGTILAEALLGGWKVLGSDIAQEAAEATEKNISWLTGKYALPQEGIRVFVADATHASDHVNPHSIDAIVTEPFMGDPRLAAQGAAPNETKVKNIVKGLEKLYLGCFKEWSRILSQKGKIIIALPEIVSGHRTYPVKNVVDRCESLGYTLVAGPIEYSRPTAIVRRQFYIFQKKS